VPTMGTGETTQNLYNSRFLRLRNISRGSVGWWVVALRTKNLSV
jgi:hypothetical protein